MGYSHYYEKSGMLHGSVPLIMGTRLDALLFGKNPVELNDIWNWAIVEMKRLHSLLNRFDPESELSLLNKTAGHFPAGVNQELWEILLDCRKYHELTFGYFDITLTDFNTVDFDMANHTLFFRERKLSLDLGGYAKGYAMKKLRKMLCHAGIHQSFFNFGNSSVMTLGNHPSGKSWLVGIDHPFHPGRQLGSVELCDQALSTSGNLPGHLQHIVNPHTGEYFGDRKVVSVVAEDDLAAEVLSTTLLLAGDETAEQVKKNFNNITVYTFELP